MTALMVGACGATSERVRTHCHPFSLRPNKQEPVVTASYPVMQPKSVRATGLAGEYSQPALDLTS
ncbi:hypothetical protein BH10PSE8_BH10PSE8_05780 [soil metagenome]|jgi:hypothetical protein